MSVSKTEADVIFNRANLALARSQRLIASWLPPKTAEEIANTKSEEELQREEDEIFTPVPEKLGLGASLPKSQADGSFNRTELSSNEKLRKQLLGKNYKRPTASKSSHPAAAGKKYPQHPVKPQLESDDDEDEGRSSLGRNKRKRMTKMMDEVGTGVTTTSAVSGSVNGKGKGKGKNTDDEELPGELQRSTQRRKPVSYLDELLSERSKKKKKSSS
ncbi:uncharacterized protein PADG_00318 [Paracoccidioides brasiliensis Pb18]|uniref:Uncharacterized protein n=2 Tax=Paracoccidioides brasiliensis TaxID=121759 RepID=C1G0C8_PARBD|nr:uncharacterized protein PADG_00318 [Paracoccidioides brasiliensis Pb18]EEH44029.1 hypothetical protein PADG_00318 [Paracoccidioides brasiliensis Pb18]ODH13799.1 hypothetical protein ACO22_06897 [Paracoccidioides brasiliensis]ODH48711.1 hypothetical protein GX48_05146 [Paracoccidioides brasiliensis]